MVTLRAAGIWPHRRDTRATLEAHPMDADRFDTLLHALSQTPSRRAAVRMLVGSILGGSVTLGHDDAGAHDALKKCKKKSGKQKKKCLKKAKDHNATHAVCTPNCAGKTCGDNGCGGSCGTCR